MALKLVKNLSSGGTVEYWKLGQSMSVDIVNKTITVSMEVFVNAAARQSGKRQIMIHDVERIDSESSLGAGIVILTGQDAIDALKTGDPRPALYAAAKAKPFFANSEDC